MKQIRILAVVLLGLLAIPVLMPGLWSSTSYEEQFREEPEAPPSTAFPLGTDALGRDRLVRLLYGTRVSLLLAPAAALLSCLTAAAIGGIAGFFGGWADRIVQAASDLFLSLPWLFLLLTARAYLPLNTSPAASVGITFLLLGLLGWPGPAKVVRAAVVQLRNSDFILQAKVAGIGTPRMVMRHMLPNVMPVLLAQFWVTLPAFVLTEATLGMLGLGVSEPLPSLGSLLREMQSGDLRYEPWIAAPAVLLALVVGCFQLILPRKDYSV